MELENIFNSVCERLNKTDEYNLLHTWIQKYNKKDWHQTHIHNPMEGDYSFIYYIECSDKSSFNIFILDYPYIMEELIHVVVKKGRCVIFKGGIPHEVRSNNDNVRKVVSGNIKFI